MDRPYRFRYNAPSPSVKGYKCWRTGEYFSHRPPTPLLDTVNYPIHMKNLSVKELKQLADELRSDVIFHVSKTGGHLGSSLGVVELTVALHYVFNAPQDKILWDVGHQVLSFYLIPVLRWMAVGRDLKGRKNNVIAVIGDGAMTAGQAYEAMNNAGYLDSDMIVILNDNKQVSLPTASLDGPIPPVGALSSALSRLQSSRPLRELREVAKQPSMTGHPASGIQEEMALVFSFPKETKVFRLRILIEGERVALLGYGAAVQSCLAAASLLEQRGLRVTVADARFCKPLDHALIRNLSGSHQVLITVEEGSIGGFGSHVAQFMALNGLLDGTTKPPEEKKKKKKKKKKKGTADKTKGQKVPCHCQIPLTLWDSMIGHECDIPLIIRQKLRSEVCVELMASSRQRYDGLELRAAHDIHHVQQDDEAPPDFSSFEGTWHALNLCGDDIIALIPFPSLTLLLRLISRRHRFP
ncbi:hypothetical protein BHM03_00006907 [Ensete ventricosum]|nr:hypothetical protein BHM03_00006907 [Ensete ventricosum]